VQKLCIKARSSLICSGSSVAKGMHATERQHLKIIMRVTSVIRWREIQILNPKLSDLFVRDYQKRYWYHLLKCEKALWPIEHSHLNNLPNSRRCRNLMEIKKLKVSSSVCRAELLTLFRLSSMVSRNKWLFYFVFL
jgi:hypothetical protein